MSKGARNREARRAPVELSAWLRGHIADVIRTAPVPLDGPTEVVCVACSPLDLAAAVMANRVSPMTVRDSDGCDRCGAFTTMQDAVWVLVSRGPATLVIGLCPTCGALEQSA